MCALSLKQADFSIPLARCPYVRSSGETPACVRAWTAEVAESPLAAGSAFLVGLNHHTTHIALRERFFSDQIDRMLNELVQLGLSGASVLFTCNRIEIYGVPGSAGARAVVAHLAGRAGMSIEQLRMHLYEAHDLDAAHHLMRVAAGLESLVLGEPQILGQVVEALLRARRAGTIGPDLNRLFEAAVHAGKRARSETAISRHTLSISHAAILLAKAARPDLAKLQVLVIGAGKMSVLAVKALQAHGVAAIEVLNRDPGRGQELAQIQGVRAAPLACLSGSIASADVVIAATAAPTTILFADDIPNDGRRRLLIDLGMPRNIAADVVRRPDIELHDLDGLQQVVEQHRIQRHGEVALVERIIDQELAAYGRNHAGKKLAPVISALRGKVESVIEAELAQALRRIPELDDQSRAALERMRHRIVRKLLHAPTVALKSRDNHHIAHLMRDLLNLDLSQAGAAPPSGKGDIAPGGFRDG